MTQLTRQPAAVPAPRDAAHQSPAGRAVYLETFGCQMNVLDSQLVRGQLQAMGYSFTDDWKRADVVLYNTCSVREQAENKAYSRLGQVGQRKKTHPHIVLGVIGCMAERDGLDLFRRYPQVDLMCGPGELDKVPLLIDNVVKTRLSQGGDVAPKKRGESQAALQGNTHRRSSTLAAAEDQLEMLDLARSFSPDEHHGSAYVRITRGCNKFCTYCVVPNTRGREVHRSPDAIVDECRKLVAAGVIEITLLGQTVNHYHFDHRAAVTVNGVEQPQVGAVVKNAGNVGVVEQASRLFASPGATGGSPASASTSDHALTDEDNPSAQALAGKPPVAPGVNNFSSRGVTTFAQLLARIHDEIPDLQRLRFVTSFPRDFGDDVLHTIADRPRICRYLHLPVQSGSNRILKAMNRGYTVEEYRDLLARIRRILPDAMLASDLICGFPGETDEDHRATCDLLRDAMFKNCFIFKYSPRPGTAAFDRLPDDVPDEVKRARNNELLRIQSANSDAVHRATVGKTVRVFVESVSVKAQKARNAADPSVQLGWAETSDVTQLTGRTDGDLIVMFDGDASLIGSIVEVRVQKHAPLALFGELVHMASAR